MAIITKNPHTWFVATNSSGETQTVIVENGTTETVLTGLAVGDELSVFSTFLPENAFETFDSPRETYSLE